MKIRITLNFFFLSVNRNVYENYFVLHLRLPTATREEDTGTAALVADCQTRGRRRRRKGRLKLGEGCFRSFEGISCFPLPSTVHGHKHLFFSPPLTHTHRKHSVAVIAVPDACCVAGSL